MKKNIYQIETSKLSGGFIIPLFISNDPNLDAISKYHLSSYLYASQLTDKIKLEEKHYDFECPLSGYLDELVKELTSMYYINVISRRINKGRIKINIEIHPWYLQYIDMNPFYDSYVIEYHHFLNNVVLPELVDDKIKEKLSNSIIEYSILSRLNYLNNV